MHKNMSRGKTLMWLQMSSIQAYVISPGHQNIYIYIYFVTDSISNIINFTFKEINYKFLYKRKKKSFYLWSKIKGHLTNLILR